MLMFEITANAFVFAAISFASALIGFGLQTKKIAKSRLRISLLEREVMRGHAEILELQKDFVALELKVHIKNPVSAMKRVLESESDEKLPDVSLRKKLLGKESSPEKSEVLSLVHKNLQSKHA
jgi:hypothetical protein